MTSVNIAENALVYKGHPIRFMGEMISLTAMWKAQGSPRNKEPFNWVRKEGLEFIEHFAAAQNLTHSQGLYKKPNKNKGFNFGGNGGQSHYGGLIQTRLGRNGGTFAHWQIALAYAKYLSPEFHMWCNTAVRAVIEGDVQPLLATESQASLPLDAQPTLPMDAEPVEWSATSQDIIEALKTHIETTVKEVVGTELATLAHQPHSQPSLPQTTAKPDSNYTTISTILDEEWGVAPTRRRLLNRQIQMQLVDYCLANGFRAFRTHHKGGWMFPRQVASIYIRDNCVGLIERHVTAIGGGRA